MEESGSTSYCPAQVGGMECGQRVEREGQLCERHSGGEAAEPKPVRFGGMTASEAGRKGAEARKRALAAKAESARHVNATRRDRTPLDALRDLMSADPDSYAAGLAKLVQAGDPRSITIMRELFQADKAVRIPRAEATIRAMSREERTALLLELEARGCTLPTLPDEATADGVEGRVGDPDSLVGA